MVRSDQYRKKLAKYQEKVRLYGSNSVYQKKIAAYLKLCGQMGGGELPAYQKAVKCLRELNHIFGNQVGGTLDEETTREIANINDRLESLDNANRKANEQILQLFYALEKMEQEKNQAQGRVKRLNAQLVQTQRELKALREAIKNELSNIKDNLNKISGVSNLEKLFEEEGITQENADNPEYENGFRNKVENYVKKITDAFANENPQSVLEKPIEGGPVNLIECVEVAGKTFIDKVKDAVGERANEAVQALEKKVSELNKQISDKLVKLEEKKQELVKQLEKTTASFVELQGQIQKLNEEITSLKKSISDIDIKSNSVYEKSVARNLFSQQLTQAAASGSQPIKIKSADDVRTSAGASLNLEAKEEYNRLKTEFEKSDSR